MHNDIQLVFFDIDGTLLATDGSYSTVLQQQIYRIRQQGIKTAIASGRPSYAARFLIDELELIDLGLFCTGAELYYPLKRQWINCHYLNQELAYAIYTRAKELGFYCELYTQGFHTVDQTHDISQIHAKHLRVNPRIMAAEQVFAQSMSVMKLLLGSHKKTQVASLQDLANEFPQVEFAFAQFAARPQWEFASVISSNADKQQGFDQILNYYDMNPENVMAIGDSQSDICFLRAAGLGVAMGNATDSVKECADYITETADNDGVAAALQKFVPAL